MIFVDYREGSEHLVEPLEARGLPVDKVDLPFGDVMFEGRGVGNEPVNVGIELKKLNDLVASLRSGRLVDHQIPGMIGPQGLYAHAWLVVEGQYRMNKVGQLVGQTGGSWKPIPGRMTVTELEKAVMTIEMCMGVHVRFTNRQDDTVQFIQNLYRWWTDKALDEHTSHLTMHQPTGIIPLSDFRATLMVRCPGMGRATSMAAEVKFGGNLRKAALASAEEWAAVSTMDKGGKVKRLGLKKGMEIEAFWRGVK
jgi:ERCC4-type nuclease